jgi:hypothetical protein
VTDPKKPAWAQAGAARPHAARIDITDTPANAVLKLVQNDRAAAEACIAMVKTVEIADPQAEFGPFTPLVILDSIGLVGPAIGRFYQRLCAGDPVIALGLLHAIRLKLVPPETIKRALDGKARLDVTDLLDQVRNRMPKFGR